MKCIILHNPRCRKSREGLEYLKSKWVDFEIRQYLKEPLSLDELKDLRNKLWLPVLQWTRTKEKEFKEAGLTKNSSEEQILQAMVKFPKLIERPIVICWQKAVVARPASKIDEIL